MKKIPQLISGAAGVAACIGADFAKVNYPSEYPGMTRVENLLLLPHRLQDDAV